MSQKPSIVLTRGTIFGIVILAFIATVMVMPYVFRTKASGGLFTRTQSSSPELPNYDIRTDKAAFDKLAAFRDTSATSAVRIADLRDGFVRGESKLRETVPTLKVEYNQDLKVPEVIAPDVSQGRAFLTSSSSAKRSGALLDFLRQNDQLTGVARDEVDRLKVVADYTNPDGGLSFVELNQEINGIPVFRGEVKAGFTRRGEIVRVINNLAPGIDRGSVSSDFGDAADAAKAATAFTGPEAAAIGPVNQAVSNDLMTVFGSRDNGVTAEKMYFPTEPGVAIPAWRVLVWQRVSAFYVIVDARTGTMLWRKNLAEDQNQPAIYRIWNNPNAMINVADSPFPFTPGPISPAGQQGIFQPTAIVARIGSERPYNFNIDGWIMDGTNETNGNNVEAGLDRDPTQGVDAINGRVTGNNRFFDFPYAPYDPTSGEGDSPTPPGEPVSGCGLIPQPHAQINAQKAAIVQYFYTLNWAHDELYLLGFNEQARNFQEFNFGRGGEGGDRLSAESQDCSGTGGGNFATAADGIRPRMQMFVWTGPPVDIDAAVDAEIVIHEYVHGLSNRLHGNATGLTTNMSRGMGEGWSDFYAHSLLSDSTDPINGIYTVAGYTTSRTFTDYIQNYYYGIRRYPKAVLGFTGGVNNKPHNAYTFSYANGNCEARLTNANFAFERGPIGSGACDQVHNLGEIWSAALWEVRSKFVTRLGFVNGNRRMLQFVTDGMKLAPLAPTFLQERDAILAAAQASTLAPQAAADVTDVWAGFAARGMGLGASIQNTGTGLGNTVVTEAFDFPNLFQNQQITINDASGNNNGFPDLGETISINIPLTNTSGGTATGVSLQLVGGGSADYGSIGGVETVTRAVTYTVSSGATCGSLITLTLNVTSSLGPVTYTRYLAIGQPLVTADQTFDSVTAPALPAGWTAVSNAGGINFVTTATNPFTAPNSVFAADPSSVGGGTDLTSPAFPILAPSGTVSFYHSYNTEAGWDGGVLEISIGGGAFQDILDAGGAFVQNGYTGTLGNGTNNPLANRPGWSGVSAYSPTVARLPASAAGQSVQFRWRFGADNNTAPAGGGWNVDSVQVVGAYQCVIIDNFPRARADFDGDNRTDVSVFRPSEGNWYMNRSTAGFTGVHFGDPTDIPVPGDFDGDNKTDIAVWRPSTGVWFRIDSAANQFMVAQFGADGDVPQPGDFDGDGRDDLAVWRPSTGAWYWLNSSNGQFNGLAFGQNGDLPVAGDYDGDGKDDIAVYRPSLGAWYRINSSNGQFAGVGFGLATDQPTHADFDGDGKEDIAVFRPSDGVWYRLNSSNGQFIAIQFGATGDVPAPGDYDGDGKDDQAVYRSGVWYLNRSTSGFAAVPFGIANDTPIPKKYIP